MRVPRRTARLVAALAVGLALTACSDDGADVSSEGTSSTTGSGSGSGSGSASGSGSSAGALGYGPVSSVDEHGAIGDDVAAIREALEPAKDGGDADWAAIDDVWRNGENSQSSDGTNRTLRELAPEHAAVTLVDDAIAGTGDAASAGPAVRAQYVEKGLTVILAAKSLAELDEAAAKVADGETDPAEGAPHNVDEAFAFFAANGNGPAGTAASRAADFDREGEVLEPIVDALKAAQEAAIDGDGAALRRAARDVRTGLDYVFYLATFKYLGGADEVEWAEGAAYYLGIQERVTDASARADRAIVDAFESGGTESGREALNSRAVLRALGVDESERVTA